MQNNLLKSFLLKGLAFLTCDGGLSRPIVRVFSDPAPIQSCLFPHNLMSQPPVSLLQVFQAAFHAAKKQQ